MAAVIIVLVVRLIVLKKSYTYTEEYIENLTQYRTAFANALCAYIIYYFSDVEKEEPTIAAYRLGENVNVVQLVYTSDLFFSIKINWRLHTFLIERQEAYKGDVCYSAKRFHFSPTYMVNFDKVSCFLQKSDWRAYKKLYKSDYEAAAAQKDNEQDE